MCGHLQNSEKSRRALQLSAVCEDIRKENFKKNKGKTFSVLFETPKNGWQIGYTRNYIPVKVATNTDLSGKIANVIITDTDDDCCIGEII